MKYYIEYDIEEDGRWIAEVPEIAGALAYGWSKEEAKGKVLLLIEDFIKTNYEELRDSKMLDPEFRAKYTLAKEKLDIELMLDSIKEGVNQKKSSNTILRRINKLSKHISNISLE